MPIVDYALVYKNAAQTIANSGYVTQVYEVEDADTGALVDLGTNNDRFIVPVDFNGRYGSHSVSIEVTNVDVEAASTKNNAGYAGGSRARTASSVQPSGAVVTSAPVQLATDDYFFARVRRYSGGSSSLGSLNKTWGQLEIRDTSFNGALVYKSANQALTSGVDATVSWNSEVYDLDTWHDNTTNNSRLTVPSGVSLVRLSANLLYTAFSTGRAGMRLKKNGSVVTGGFNVNAEMASLATKCFNGISAPLAVTPGDYFEIETGVNYGSENVSANSGVSTWFAVEELDSDLNYALVSLSTDFSLAAATDTPIEWATENVDVGGWFDVGAPTRLTVPSGMSHVRLVANVCGASVADEISVSFRKNGADAVGMSRYDVGTGTDDYAALHSAILQVTPGDYFEVYANSVTARDVLANASTWFSIEEVRTSEAPAFEITPDSGPTSGGTSVTITGTGFTNATGVLFDTDAATSFLVVNDTTITCDSPAHAAGLVSVTVQDPDGDEVVPDAFEFIDPLVRVTQTPLLVAMMGDPEVRVTQVPLLVVSLPVQGARVTQAPSLVSYLPKAIPLPLPVVPEIPVVEVWQWLTVLTTADGGQEQRSAVRGDPRVNMSFNAIMLDDEDRRDVYQMLFKYVKQSFNYPLYSHSVKLDAAASAGATKLYFDPSLTDIRADEGIALFDPHLEQTTIYTVSTVDADGATLSSGLLGDTGPHWLVCPAPTFRTPPIIGFSMSSIDGSLDLELLGTQPRAVLRPNQSSGLLTTLDGMLVLDVRPLANIPVDENFDQNVEWLDNRIAPPEAKTNWYTPFISGQRTYLIHRPSGMDYWRAVADNLKGRQNPFLLPTFRDDLPLLSQPALGATILVSTNVQFFDFWRSKAWRYLMIQSDAGTIIRKVAEVTVNYNSGGDPISSNIKLTSSIGSGTGANENMVVSFVNTCRLGTDEIRFEHGPVDSYVSFQVRGIEE